jgi:hypothetical protein
VKRLLLQNVCDLSNNMNGLRFPCFGKSGNAEVSALHHDVPDLHRKMLLATLWNTYLCINEALALTLNDVSLDPPHPYRQLITLTPFQ